MKYWELSMSMRKIKFKVFFEVSFSVKASPCALSMIYLVKRTYVPTCLFSLITTLFIPLGENKCGWREKTNPRVELNAFMLSKLLFSRDTIIFLWYRASKGKTTTKKKERSERCHHFKRSLKVYTFLWKEKNGIGRRDWRNIVLVYRKKQKTPTIETLGSALFIELTREKERRGAGEERKKKFLEGEDKRKWQQNYTSFVNGKGDEQWERRRKESGLKITQF